MEGFERILPEMAQACREHGRDSRTLKSTVTVLLADSSADPWWDRLPTNSYAEEGPLVPLTGGPQRIAEELLRYGAAGASHIQISLEPTTCATIEALAPVLEILDRG